MKRFMLSLAHKYLDKKLDLRVRLFNILALGGISVALLVTAMALFHREPLLSVLANFISAPTAYLLMRHAARTGNYRLCYLLTVFFVFLILFPVIFFTGGGYHGAMPSFFIFAVLFTVFMLDGKISILLSALELAVYTSLCVIAYRNPEFVTPLSSELAVVTDIIVGFTLASMVLGVCMFLHFRLYNEQQRQLAEQNRFLSQLDRMKTEFFANVSHEMKTPLTVISVHIQRAEALLALGRDGDAKKIRESFALAQDEIMRMSRLVNSSLALASLQEQGDEAMELDMSGLLRATAEAYRAVIEKGGNRLTLELPEDLPPVYGSADRLIQLFSNLLTNAITYANGGEIRVKAAHDGEILTVTVADSGAGIPPELLPLVFERGVSGGGGSGLGLAICKEIAEAHGGSISITSAENQGTAVAVTLPAFQEEVGHAER